MEGEGIGGGAGDVGGDGFGGVAVEVGEGFGVAFGVVCDQAAGAGGERQGAGAGGAAGFDRLAVTRWRTVRSCGM